MRKIATPLVILALCLSLLCACSNKAPTVETPAPVPSSEPSAPPEMPAPSAEPSTLPETAAPSEEPAQTAEPSAPPETPAPSAEPSTLPETAAPSEKPAAPPETPAPSEAPAQTVEPSAPPETPSSTPEPSEALPEPEPSEPEQVDLRAFCTALFQSPDAPMMMEIDGKDMLDAYYPGLPSVPCEQSVVFMAAMSAVAVEIALVEVSDPRDVATVKRIFQERVIAQVGTDDAPGGAWYPASIEVWKNSSRFASSGNYAMLIVSQNCDDIVRRFNALFS